MSPYGLVQQLQTLYCDIPNPVHVTLPLCDWMNPPPPNGKQAAHKMEYIPQRLEEIEREQESLKERVSEFNDKIKDTEIKQI